MQPPMPAATRRVDRSSAASNDSPPLPARLRQHPFVGLFTRIAKPQAERTVLSAKSEANESADLFSRKLIVPWRNRVISRAACLATGEAQRLEIGAHRRALPGRRGEFHELEAVDAHRVVEGRDPHSEVGLRVHGLPASGLHGNPDFHFNLNSSHAACRAIPASTSSISRPTG